MNRFVMATLGLLVAVVGMAMVAPDVEANSAMGCSGEYAAAGCSGEAYGHTGPVRGILGRGAARRKARREGRAARHASYGSCGAPAAYQGCSQPASFQGCSQPAAASCSAPAAAPVCDCTNCPVNEAKPTGPPAPPAGLE